MATQTGSYDFKAAKEAHDDAAKVANNYISTDQSGLMVADLTSGQQTPSTATGRNVLIDSDSVDIRDGQQVLASFGEVVMIGESGQSRVVLTDEEMLFFGIDGAIVGNIAQGATAVTTITENIKTVYFEYGPGASDPPFDDFSKRMTGVPGSGSGASQFITFTLELYEGVAEAGPDAQPFLPVDTVTSILSTQTHTRVLETLNGTDYTFNVSVEYYGTGWSRENTVIIEYHSSSGSGQDLEDYQIRITASYETTWSAPNYKFGSTLISSGRYAFAEGRGGSATGECSHVEGRSSSASGENSHAEGFDTTASGTNSHAEGMFTEATGQGSHAEGRETLASGDYSHVSGEKTIASGEHQTVIGRYNVEDTDGLYAFIIGNGRHVPELMREVRRNAFAVDWDGNIEMALNTSAASGTTDGDLYASITALSWESEVIV